MSKVQKITELTEPPVLGHFYMVPTVEYQYFRRVRCWPVFLPKHADAEFFNFADQHYHIDPRFLSERDFEYCCDSRRSPLARLQGSPLSRKGIRDGEYVHIPHPAVVWRRRRCARLELPYVYARRPEIQALAQAYEGQQCKGSKAGWICPHQHYAMGSLTPDAEGVITCPLHGLRILHATGKVLPA